MSNSEINVNILSQMQDEGFKQFDVAIKSSQAGVEALNNQFSQSSASTALLAESQTSLVAQMRAAGLSIDEVVSALRNMGSTAAEAKTAVASFIPMEESTAAAAITAAQALARQQDAVERLAMATKDSLNVFSGIPGAGSAGGSNNPPDPSGPVVGGLQSVSREARALRAGTMLAVLGIQELSLALGQSLPQSAQEGIKALQMVGQGAMMGMAFGPEGVAVGALTGGLLALGIATQTVDPEIAALNKSLDGLAKHDDAASGLAKLAGISEQAATSALAAAKVNADETDKLNTLAHAVEGTSASLSTQVAMQKDYSDNLKGGYSAAEARAMVEERYGKVLETSVFASRDALAAEADLAAKRKALADDSNLVNKGLDNLQPHDALVDKLTQETGASQQAVTGALAYAKAHADAATTLQQEAANLQAAESELMNYRGGQAEVYQALQDNVTAQKNAMQATTEHMALVEALNGKNANLRVTFVDETDALHDNTAALELADIKLNAVASSGLTYIDMMGNLQSITEDATGALINFNAAASHFIENQNMMTGMSGGDLQMKKFLGDDAYKANIQAGNDALTAQKKAANEAIQDQQRQQVMMDKITFASTEMTAIQVQNMMAIANSAQPVETKLAEISAYINSLSNAKEINMAITFGGDKSLMDLLGLGGAKPGSRDFGKEAEETFGKQKPKIQEDYIRDAGGNKDQGALNWAKDHMAGLVADLLRDPKQFVNTGAYAAAQAALAFSGSTVASTAFVPPAATTAGVGLQGTQAGGALNKGMGDAIATQFQPDQFVSTAITARGKALEDQGGIMGKKIITGMYDEAKNSDFAAGFVKALMPELDRYYKRSSVY